MTNIEKNQEQQNDLSTLENKANNLTPEQKKEVGDNVDKEKALLDWRESGAYKFLPTSYTEFIQDLKTVEYDANNKYVANILAYIRSVEKVSLTVNDIKASKEGFVSKNNKTIALQNIYADLSKSAILAYKQANTGGIAQPNQLPENVNLGDMKLLDNINILITKPDYKNMMQYIQKCREDDNLIKSQYLKTPKDFYSKLQDEVSLDSQNPGFKSPLHELFNNLLNNKLTIGKVDAGTYRESSNNTYTVGSIDDKSFLPVEKLTWHDISPAMQAYIKPILESLFPYHTYGVDAKGTVRMAVYPQNVYKKLKEDRDTKYESRVTSTGFGSFESYPVLEQNFTILPTDQREALSLCLSNTTGLPSEVFAVQESYNTRVLKEMGAPDKLIVKPFGRMGIDEGVGGSVYTAEDIVHWKDGEASSNKALSELYTNIQNAEKYGKLLRFEPSGSGYKMVVYYTGYSTDGKAKEVNFLNRRPNGAKATF